MSVPQPPRMLQQFVDDELLRAPLLFDQVIEGSLERLHKNLPSQSPSQRATGAELIEALQACKPELAEMFVRSLRQQAQDDLAGQRPHPLTASAAAGTLALVGEDEVAMDIELAHTIEAIKSCCEHELRELATYTSALLGDMDVARDHNPFRAETYARALTVAARGLGLQTAHQTLLMRHAGFLLAQGLRRTYAAASSRLENQGIEPAAYRTVILPTGVRSGGRYGETTYSPDLHRMRDSMPAPSRVVEAVEDTGPVLPGDTPSAATPDIEPWTAVVTAGTSRADRQAVELVSRLFEAMMIDERVPDDARPVIARLHGPALRMTLRDPSLLDQGKHPLWRFINRLVFEAQMTPDRRDPDRLQLLKLAQGTAEQLAIEPEQDARLYRWALERLETFLKRRFTRRLSAAASHIGALQKLEDKLAEGRDMPSTMLGMLDVPQLDTVPAELMADDRAPEPGSRALAEAWLDHLAPGDWVRLFLQGRWVHAALLWPGEQREVWLFGDGASDATWAVRRNALLMMYATKMAKKLKQRSVVGSAAARVHHEISSSSTTT